MPDRIAAQRKARGWSLRALASASGVSAAMLSEIERGAKNPTVKLAYQIAQALDCSISSLVEEPSLSPVPDRSLQRGAVLENDGVRRVGHTPDLGSGPLELASYELAPDCGVEALEPNRAGTRETVIVQSGTLELVLDGEAFPIAAGERRTHGVAQTEYRNASSDELVRFLVLIDTSAQLA